MAGGEVDEPAIEVLHLHAGRLELRNEEPDLSRNLLERPLRFLHAGRVEPAAVAGHLSLHPSETLAVGHEPSARRDEPLDERCDHIERLVRLLLAEEPHTC